MNFQHIEIECYIKKKKKKTFISQKNVLEEERKNIIIIKFKVKNLKNPFINGKIKR